MIAEEVRNVLLKLLGEKGVSSVSSFKLSTEEPDLCLQIEGVIRLSLLSSDGV